MGCLEHLGFFVHLVVIFGNRFGPCCSTFSSMCFGFGIQPDLQIIIVFYIGGLLTMLEALNHLEETFVVVFPLLDE